MNSEYDFTVEINKCFSNYFPITQERFNTQIDLFLFFATIENSCKAQLNLICSSEENKHSIKDKKMAKYILYEKEMISFEKIKQSEKIIKMTNKHLFFNFLTTRPRYYNLFSAKMDIILIEKKLFSDKIL